ncbi:hypothetical protein DSM104626_02036 (plasmid) [Campylobacter coli]|nr:hypothetical protein DSM104626_02036 [Campylobacter coli]
MGEDIILSIFWGLFGFILAFTNIKFYLTTLSVLVVFSIINYWIKINIKEFVKSYFLVYLLSFLQLLLSYFILLMILNFINRLYYLILQKLKNYHRKNIECVIILNF